MKQLLPPITNTIGFVQHELVDTAINFAKWKRKISSQEFTMREVVGDFPDILNTMNPLQTPYTKILLMRTLSPWTAIFFNESHGWGCREHLSAIAERVHTFGLHISYSPIMKAKTNDKMEECGSIFFEVYGPENQGDNLNYVRFINLSYDYDRWDFSTWGDPLPFERIQYYKAKRKRDRFNVELLNEYMGHYGIKYFDPKFYMPNENDKAFIIEEIAETR